MTRLIAKTEKLKQEISLSTEKETFNTMMSQPRAIINTKNPSFGY
jgi:hypothetical protein